MQAIAAALGLHSLAAPAQTPPAGGTDSGSGKLEEIVVTAQRRAENIQDVPVSVAAYSRDTLQIAGIDRVMDLQQVDPSLSLSAQSGAVIPFIRGIGNIASQTPGNESSVPVYIDDAYYSRLFVPYLSFADNIERVEVLKGPQGTLFGRNATGGLINIVTRDPGQETEFSARVGFGSQQTLTGQFYAAAPITENLAADFSFIGQDMGEGFGKNLFNGEDTYFRDFYTLRSKAVWTPTEATTVKLSGLYAFDRSSIGAVGGGGLKGFPRGLPPGFTEPFDQPNGFYDISVNYNTVRHHKGYAFTLRVDQELGFADFSSISFYRDSEEPWTSEGDHTDQRWLQYDLDVKDKQFTQEFQLKSNADSAFDWIVGLYYMDADAAYDPTVVEGDAIELGGNQSVVLIGKQNIESTAGFGQVTFPLLTDSTNVTLGARYTVDDVTGFGRQYGIALGTGDTISFGPDYHNDANFDKFTYKVSLDHHFGDATMGYASYSTGYKSGVFNLLPLDSPAVPPEEVTAYEIGLKMTLADGRMRLNTSAFWNDIENLQTNVVKVGPGGVATVQLASAEEARTRGVEIEGDVLLLEGLTARFSGTYIDAEFVEFPNAPFVTPIFEAPFGLVPGVGDVAGFRLPQVPEWKFNAGLDYEVESDFGRWQLGANVAYRSSFPWEADNVAEAPDLTLFNANVMFIPAAADHMSIRVWGKNLTGEEYYGNLLSQTGPAGFLTSPAEGRTYGVEFGFRY